MFVRTLLVAGLSVIAFLVTSLAVSAAPLEENETVKLPGGHVVKVLSISKVEYSKGVMALMVRYETHLSIEARKALSEEVDDVWKLTEKQVEHLGYDEAILSSNEVPRGIFITSSREQRFIFEKESDGKWTRLNRAEFMAAQ